MPLSENANVYREKILAEIQRLGHNVTRWRTGDEWQEFSGLSDMQFMGASTELKRYDPTLSLETKENSRPQVRRWKTVQP